MFRKRYYPILPIVCLITTFVSHAAPPLVPIGQQKQLFVDDYVIEEMNGVTRQLGTVTKARGGRPVFMDGWFYGTVLHEAGKFKMWFRKPDNAHYGYAESDDGLNFVKQAELSGINFAGDINLAVTIDTHETDPAHRYKAGYDAPGRSE
jgi:hypothetical protein